MQKENASFAQPPEGGGRSVLDLPPFWQLRLPIGQLKIDSARVESVLAGWPPGVGVANDECCYFIVDGAVIEKVVIFRWFEPVRAYLNLAKPKGILIVGPFNAS